MYDAIIVGGGPAGLSAALILGRCRRRVLLCDSGRYRNDASHAMHGFLSRDGIDPAELRRIGREQLRPYSVEIRDITVTDIHNDNGKFEVTLQGGERVRGRKLLLATGLVDQLPEIEGIKEMYGKSVFHCPYCDGWEVRDKPLAVYGPSGEGATLALTLRTWSADVLLCTNGPAKLESKDAALLERHRIRVREDKIARLAGSDGMLERIIFERGDSVARSAFFLKTSPVQASSLALKLRLPVSESEGVQRGEGKYAKYEETYMKGVFVAGDASKDVLLAIVAAAEGAKAAFGMNCELMEEEQQGRG